MRDYHRAEQEADTPQRPGRYHRPTIVPARDDDDLFDDGPVETFSERELLARYLREAGQIPLLTPAAEVELFRQFAEGTVAEQAEARAALIAANLRLVVGVARHYVGLGLSLPELIAEGNLGLIAAVDRFERARGHRFSTFARWPIRKAITRALDDRARLVRLPANSWQALRELRRAEDSLPDELGREPTPTELAHACGVALWRFDALRVAAAAPSSLDAPVRGPDADGADESTIGDTIEDRERPLPIIVGNRIARASLDSILGTLPPRERALLVLRHGLDGGAPRTLQQVGDALGISGERTRQLEARALTQLRTHPLTQTLRDSLD
jgi:RNA polymerase primary sigma factor